MFRFDHRAICNKTDLRSYTAERKCDEYSWYFSELEMANIWARSGQFEFAETSRRRVGANVLTEPKCYFASNDCSDIELVSGLLDEILLCTVSCSEIELVSGMTLCLSDCFPIKGSNKLLQRHLETLKITPQVQVAKNTVYIVELFATIDLSNKLTTSTVLPRVFAMLLVD
eukprot:g18005.t1